MQPIVRWIAGLAAVCLSAAAVAQTAPGMLYMRAVHFGGNYGFNIDAIKSIPNDYYAFLDRNQVNWVGVAVAVFQNSVSDPTVRIRYRPAGAGDDGLIYTFDDADLLAFISALRARGMHVYLTLAFESPLNANADPSTGCGTPQYYAPRWAFGEPTVPAPLANCVPTASWWWSPSHPAYASNVATFWNSYGDIAAKYAALAQQSGVELFSLGTETEGIFRTRTGPRYSNEFRAQLQGLVAKVRGAYHGLVSYDQYSDVEQVSTAYQEQGYLFSDLDLDVVGVSAYFRVTSSNPSAPMSVGDLQAQWHSIFQNQLVPLGQKNPGKPIVFLEFGYTDTVAAPGNPTADEYTPYVTSDANGNGIDDGFEQQANNFDAFFRENAANGNLVAGTFLWDAGANGLHYVTNDRVFSVYDKPAELVFRNVYAQYASAAPGPLSGLWWNASESGWGVDFTQRRNVIFAAWYTYDVAGNPKWYVASDCAMPAGVVGASGTCSGSLYEVAGPAFFGAAFNPNAVNAVQAGTLQVSFRDAGNASMTYTVAGQTRTVAITRQPITGGVTPSAIDYTDLWWNASESGWGLAIAQQYGVMFLAWFVYDSAGKPTWYVASDCAVSATGCSGALYRTKGPPLGPTFDATSVQVFAVGTASLTFTGSGTGTLNYTVDGVSGSKTISRQLF
jgi:hypothetical protein